LAGSTWWSKKADSLACKAREDSEKAKSIGAVAPKDRLVWAILANSAMGFLDPA
jgi:hypothetical protein